MPDLNPLWAWTLYGWIGWAVLTVLLGGMYLLTGMLGKRVFARLKRIYWLNALDYWFTRLEREGIGCFRILEREKRGLDNR